MCLQVVTLKKKSPMKHKIAYCGSSDTGNNLALQFNSSASYTSKYSKAVFIWCMITTKDSYFCGDRLATSAFSLMFSCTRSTFCDRRALFACGRRLGMPHIISEGANKRTASNKDIFTQQVHYVTSIHCSQTEFEIFGSYF